MNKELSVGMYARTNNGIVKIENYNYHEELPDNPYDFNKHHIYKQDIINASHNIIDLIEVGDVVSVRIHGDVSKYEVEQFDLTGKIIGIRVQILEDIRIFELKELDIISIVTKEQFKSVEYEV